MSSASKFNPRRLDVQAFARSQGTLEGVWSASALTRLREDHQGAEAGEPLAVTWSAQGLWHQPLGGQPEVRLHLQAQATVWQTCQRCLQGLPLPLSVDRTFRFVGDEDQAAALDDESEEDVLPLDRTWDLAELIEDELIMALPIVPRHEVCPVPLTLPEAAPAGPVQDVSGPGTDEPSSGRPNPFAVLAQLKTKPPAGAGER